MFLINGMEFNIESYNKNEFQIKSYNKTYTATINKNTLNDIVNSTFELGDYIILDDHFKNHLNEHEQFVYYVNATEQNKTIHSVLEIIEFLYKKKFCKPNKLIVIGGGITQDIGGFVAGIFKRGINWVYIPTTFLAMTDSCIGGKVGVNHISKNMLGMFCSPNNVVISEYFLNTLSNDMIISGLGESLKLSIIAGKNEVDDFFKLYKQQHYLSIIKQSLVIKKSIIEYDELEKCERQVLNYGHTFGHAIESSTNYFIPHGIAVLFGMYYINTLFNVDKFNELNKQILKMIPTKYYIQFDPKSIIEHLKNDKKNKGSNICFIIPNDFGDFVIKYVNLVDVEEIINFIFKTPLHPD